MTEIATPKPPPRSMAGSAHRSPFTHPPRHATVGLATWHTSPPCATRQAVANNSPACTPGRSPTLVLTAPELVAAGASPVHTPCNRSTNPHQWIRRGCACAATRFHSGRHEEPRVFPFAIGCVQWVGGGGPVLWTIRNPLSLARSAEGRQPWREYAHPARTSGAQGWGRGAYPQRGTHQRLHRRPQRSDGAHHQRGGHGGGRQSSRGGGQRARRPRRPRPQRCHRVRCLIDAQRGEAGPCNPHSPTALCKTNRHRTHRPDRGGGERRAMREVGFPAPPCRLCALHHAPTITQGMGSIIIILSLLSWRGQQDHSKNVPVSASGVRALSERQSWSHTLSTAAASSYSTSTSRRFRSLCPLS